MNIFVTSFDPHVCAIDHCKIHRTKMILEYAQLMSTAHDEWGTWTDAMYKPTHRNHPSAIWTRLSWGNYNYVYTLWKSLLLLYTRDTRKQHASSRLLDVLKPKHRDVEPVFIPSMLAMPDDYKSDNIEKSYQDYLNSKFNEWRSRPKPLSVEFIRVPSWYKL